MYVGGGMCVRVHVCVCGGGCIGPLCCHVTENFVGYIRSLDTLVLLSLYISNNSSIEVKCQYFSLILWVHNEWYIIVIRFGDINKGARSL